MTDPGISVLEDAQVALKAGRVTGMHDPTEGGLASALWEMAHAANCSILFDPNTVPIPKISARICQALDVDPLAAISPGALLIGSPTEDSGRIIGELTEAGIESACIGRFKDGDPAVWLFKDNKRTLLPRPKRDEVARLLENRVD